MQTLEHSEDTAAAARKGEVGRRPPLTTKQKAQYVLGAILLAVLVVWAFVEPKIRTTLITVIVAVAASAGVWVGANLSFNQARARWTLFQSVSYAVIGALLGMVLHGNLLTVGSGTGFFAWVLGPLVGAAAFGAVGYALATTDDPARRRLISIGGLAAVGLLIGLVIREAFQPGLDTVAIVVYTVILAAIGGGISVLRKRPPLGGALIGGALGWILGAWGGADLGDGNVGTAIVAAVLPAAALGVRLGMSANPDYTARLNLETR